MSNNGISFVVRIRNEEQTLEKSIKSLQGLTIPYEINATLHCCTDRSKEILQDLGVTKIREFNQTVSKPGYETLVTPSTHPRSFISYAGFCFNECVYNWMFRWDADFFASPKLIEHLNNMDLQTTEKIKVCIPCKIGDTEILNKEIYLSNCLIAVAKQMFWEVYVHGDPVKPQEVFVSDDVLIDTVSNVNVKKHWYEDPWFFEEDKDLTDKYNLVVSMIGSEPKGLARASNPECDPYSRMVMQKAEVLRKAGIYINR